MIPITKIEPREADGKTEIVIEGVLKPGGRVVEGPFGEAPGYLGPQRYTTCVHYEVRAINYRNGAMYQSVITPEGDKPWMDLPREGAYLRRCREAVLGMSGDLAHLPRIQVPLLLGLERSRTGSHCEV